MKYDCVIIGAGLAGLSCAHNLSKAGKKILVLDKNSHVGGRLQSVIYNNTYIIDQGFQTVLSSYEELKKLDLDNDLKMHTFNSGALIYDGTNFNLLANPFYHLSSVIQTLSNESIHLKDYSSLFKLTFQSIFRNQLKNNKQTTNELLKSLKFSQSFTDHFLQPFFSGVFLDKKLNYDSAYFLFLFKNFLLGRVTLPEYGIQSLPEKIAEPFINNVRLNTDVVSWNSKLVITGEYEKIQTEHVVCAFDTQSLDRSYNAATTYYFSVSKSTQSLSHKWIVLIPETLNLKINHVVNLSQANPNYSRSNEDLISVSVLDSGSTTTEEIQTQLGQIFKDADFKFVTKTFVAKALPATEILNTYAEIVEDVVYCGDHLANPSINGALKSGRIAANLVLSRMYFSHQKPA